MELVQAIKQSDKVQIEKQAEIKKQVQFVGKIKLHPGQKLFEFDLSNGNICVTMVDTELKISGGVNKKLTIKDNCLYAVAINRENAARKFLNKLKDLNARLRK